ncbi:MAG: polyphosphate kinase 1 [Bacteroidota bacterium]
MKEEFYKHRDINWLFFNERVLLEAADTTTPLLERLKFLAIFSSNLDEFFKVRISQLRQLKKVDKSLRKKLLLRPNSKLKYILRTIDEQQRRFGRIRKDIFAGLETHGIYFKKPEDLSESHITFLRTYFKEEILEDCAVQEFNGDLELLDSELYLLVQSQTKVMGCVRIPTHLHHRFVALPDSDTAFVFLDDVLRLNLDLLFPKRPIGASYALKLSRDAELYLEDDYGDTALVERIYNSLEQRDSGQPTRLLYDEMMPKEIRKELRKRLDLGKVDMFPGGTYHNFSDFFGFGHPTGDPNLVYALKKALPHPVLSGSRDLFESISQKDQLIHFPYQSFEVVEQFLLQAARDTLVERIKISLYRIAKSSVLTDALLLALQNKKEVIIFVEAKARFDEKNNIEWGKTFADKGAQVFFSVPNIKVHSKIALIERKEDGVLRRYAYIGTGNFNSKTAKLYCDHGLFTAHLQITEDLHQVFGTLERKLIVPRVKQLLVSPYSTRITFLQCIEREVENHLQGMPASIMIKMNSLEDPMMIKALQRASSQGVRIQLLVRGFCCLVPKPKTDLIEGEVPVRITSIVDRYLEHGRVYWFQNGGEEEMYLGSADWMGRNLDRRIEVLVPILDEAVFRELKEILLLQFSDNIKARVLDMANNNRKVGRKDGAPGLRSQSAIYDYLGAKLKQ